MSPEPGWYSDPEGTAPYRWWDGECWTAWQTSSRTAGPPPPGPVERVAPVRRRRLGRAAGLVTLAVVVLLGAATAYGWRLRDQDRALAIAALPTALGTPATDPMTGTLVTIDPSTLLARVTTVSSMLLPQGWTTSSDAVGTATWEAYAIAYDASTPTYTADATWRPATVAYGVLVTEATVAGDMQATAAITMGSMPGSLYSQATDVTMAPITTAAVTDYPNRLAGEATTTFSFTADGRQLTAKVTVIAVQQSVRAIIGVVLIEPEQATDGERAQLAEARSSLWVR